MKTIFRNYDGVELNTVDHDVPMELLKKNHINFADGVLLDGAPAYVRYILYDAILDAKIVILEEYQKPKQPE